MKYLLIFLSISASILSCNKNTQQNEQADVTTAPPSQLPPTTEEITESVMVVDKATGQPVLGSKPVNALSTAIGENPFSKKDIMEPRPNTPNPVTAQETRVVRVLTTELWAVWALVRIKDKEANRTNQGAWFKFNPDGSYEYGFWDKKIGKGAWSFDGTTANLLLDSELQGDDREWRIQMGTDEDVMVWVGTERFHTTDTQLKLQRFANVPKTRLELGVAE